MTTLPREICRLPLQTLLVSHNRLTSLPEELGRMSVLAELDAGCNEITILPLRMGDLSRLRCLDLRSNFLVHIPIGKFFRIFLLLNQFDYLKYLCIK
jgi:Leucine-rich repeat (LRR) protein